MVSFENTIQILLAGIEESHDMLIGLARGLIETQTGCFANEGQMQGHWAHLFGRWLVV